MSGDDFESEKAQLVEQTKLVMSAYRVLPPTLDQEAPLISAQKLRNLLLGFPVDASAVVVDSTRAFLGMGLLKF